MADATCPLRFEDCSALRADEALPPELRTVLDDAAGTVELSDSYDMELTGVEA
jgi:hypothetical protein